MSTVATICASCPAGRAGLAVTVRERLEPLGVTVRETDCMSGCARPSTLAFRATGKVTYLFGEITEADLPEIETFARLYMASADGAFPDARVLGGLRLKAIARIPG
ncbi:DUF1636 family protein [Frigidibacter sp. RF13]|uniref:DUF1636 family protein n=1 Tax=Frigidibacter sp. RF13 TaxID=2997340 RepID=UPI002270C714|nr:DUF1636 family protein [Frigidibacter sp. RF13]MCY1128353.1 DUF1636 family protein [Frigidibacter sp. RF13]